MGQGDSSVSEGLALQTRINSQNPCLRKLGMVVNSYNPSAGETETDGSSEPSGSQSSLLVCLGQGLCFGYFLNGKYIRSDTHSCLQASMYTYKPSDTQKGTMAFFIFCSRKVIRRSWV